MKDITTYIFNWAMCCRSVWENWFQNLNNGDDEFIEVEKVLFSTLVLSRFELADRPGLDKVYPVARGLYKNPVNAVRSVCVKQSAGNIYCQSKRVDFTEGTSLPIKSIDCLGTMLDGETYVELILNEREYLLEPLSNLTILADISVFQDQE